MEVPSEKELSSFEILLSSLQIKSLKVVWQGLGPVAMVAAGAEQCMVGHSLPSDKVENHKNAAGPGLSSLLAFHPII